MRDKQSFFPLRDDGILTSPDDATPASEPVLTERERHPTCTRLFFGERVPPGGEEEDPGSRSGLCAEPLRGKRSRCPCVLFGDTSASFVLGR